MWKVLTAAVIAVLVIWEPRAALSSLGGAACGVWATLALLQLTLLIGALLFRVRVSLVVIGVGSEVRTWTRPERRVVLRTVPLLVSVGVTSIRTPVRPRLWLCSLLSVLITAAAVAVPWFALTEPFPRGVAIGGTAVLVNALVPRRGAGVTSPGWFLFALPRLTGRPAAELDATPLVTRISDAVHEGHLDEAEKLAGELLAEHPTLLVAIGSRISVLTMRGRYAEALHLVSSLVGRTDLTPRDMAFVMAEMASSTANAMEAGQLPAEIGMGAAHRAIEGAIELGYPRYRACGTLAQLALLTGDHAKALDLGVQAKHTSQSSLGRADALATIARAHMAAGNNAAARETLTEAETLAPWAPRVAETSARLHIT
ncbi:hypothetical protein GCM10022243_49960 [Saccharothrix violaceirubra]|uniref:Tetratricopeptide repeat protein n=1 Tax=Saccharothrix violaceirubra TaxID=413306 RepID=A0A7W7WTZ6_9PSEU|nr:hypothetical protein [Saccharothrix violaceirubra]MBB4963661.1 hypothetical protein [Saccharothrix violaceirubra]